MFMYIQYLMCLVGVDYFLLVTHRVTAVHVQ